MDCIEPGRIAAEDLLAYATGQADGQTVGHIAACPACQAEAATYATIDDTLRTRLYRVDCPDAQTLGELALDMLAPQEELAVRGHLALCGHCRDELAILGTAVKGDVMEDLIAPPGPLARLVARLLPAPGLRPAYGGVRGTAEGAPLTYQAGDVTVSLTIEADGNGPARRWTVLGLVVDEASETPPSGSQVRLLQAGGVAREAMLDEVGNFTVPDLERGLYDLELTFAAGLIAVEGIEVGPARSE